MQDKKKKDWKRAFFFTLLFVLCLLLAYPTYRMTSDPICGYIFAVFFWIALLIVLRYYIKYEYRKK